jgi:hypothetical protein
MKSKSDNKYYLVILAIVLVAAIAVFVLIMFSGNGTTTLIVKDPAAMALTIPDLFNIPNGFVFNSTLSEQTYKFNSYWTNESEKQAAIAQGFTNGYIDYFLYQNPNQATDIKTVGTSISVFNQSAQEVLNEDVQSFANQYKCTSFSIPTIGDSSFGCYTVLNISGATISYYDILFYKNNVVVRTWVGRTGLVDLSAEAVQYANIISNRIA